MPELDPYLYYFNPTEMQARLSQYFHYSKTNGVVVPNSEEGEKILSIRYMFNLIQDMNTKVGISLGLYNFLRMRQGKKMFTSIDNESIIKTVHSKMLKYYSLPTQGDPFL